MAEYHRLEAAAAALEGADIKPAKPATAANGRRRPPAKRGGSTGRRGRPKGSGSRAAEALAIVATQPGITIPELAAKMGIQANYLYRVMPDLLKDGKVEKQGKGWHPVAAVAPTEP